MWFALLSAQQQITLITVLFFGVEIILIISSCNLFLHYFHSLSTLLSLSISVSLANSEWKGNQAALHPLVLRRGRRRNLAAEGVGEWKWLASSDEVVWVFFSALFPRWQNNYTVVLLEEIQLFCVNIVSRSSDTAIVEKERNPRKDH